MTGSALGFPQLIRGERGREAEEQRVRRGMHIEYGIMQFKVPLWELWHLSKLQGLVITVQI